MSDPGSVWGVGVIEGILHQSNLAGIQMLHLLLADHDLLQREQQINTELKVRPVHNTRQSVLCGGKARPCT